MHYRHNPQGYFIRRVSDNVFVYHCKAQRTGAELRTSMALIRERHQSFDIGQDIPSHFVGNIGTCHRR
jgi:hypothetical protein